MTTTPVAPPRSVVHRPAGTGPATWAMGSLFEHLVSADESGGLGVSLVTQPPGIATPLHRHTHVGRSRPRRGQRSVGRVDVHLPREEVSGVERDDRGQRRHRPLGPHGGRGALYRPSDRAPPTGEDEANSVAMQHRVGDVLVLRDHGVLERLGVEAVLGEP